MAKAHEGQAIFDIDYVSNLELKNNMLSIFLDNSEAGIYATDYYTGEILFANKKMISFGSNHKDVESIVGQTCWHLINGESEERCSFCPYKKLLVNGKPTKPYAWEQQFKPYGFWLRVISQVITWADGRLAQINTFYDISEIKEMEKQIAEHAHREEQWKMQSNLHLVLDSLPLPVRIVDVETQKIAYVNRKCVEMFGYVGRDDLIGSDIASLLPDKLKEGVKPQAIIKEILACDDISNTELEYVTSTGDMIHTRLTSCIIDYNGRKASVGIITDLSLEKEQKRMLMQAAEKEREANQLKSSFLSNMSHEIRTPMNAIIGLTEIEMERNPSVEMMRVFTKINKAAKSLLQIINDILDLSKIEANKIELFPVEFELEEVLNSALSIAASRLKGKQVELLLDYPLDLPRLIIGDKTRLWQILRNNLDNAAKFTMRGNIVLTVEEDTALSSTDNIRIAFTIADTGDGLTQEQLAKAFLPYEQMFGDAEIRNSGSGLGLPISKHLCELMGGTMQMESKAGSGTTIKLSIPFARKEACYCGTDLSEGSFLAGRKVLMIDDSMLMLLSMQKLLDSLGAKPVMAISGEEALDIIREHNSVSSHFDIIMVDYLMEGIDGIETLKLIRQEIEYDPIVLILTSYENLISKEELESCHIDDMIDKPVIPAHFISRLKDIMGDVSASENKNTTNRVTFPDARILVCEDDIINQEVISTMLGFFSINPIIANNGKAGVELLNISDEFDLVFMDLHMPVMSGFEATRAIRSSSRLKAIPIISMSADAMLETKNRCLETGMNDCIAKPIELEELERILLQWLPESKTV